MINRILKPIVRLAQFCGLAALLFLSACESLAALPSNRVDAGVTATGTPAMDMTMNASQPTSASPTVPVTGPHVDISYFTFSPQTLTVPVGTTVTWINQDDIPHTVTSVDQRFGSQGLDTGDRYSFKFDSPGTYSYYCSIHPKMVGKIIVK